MLRRTKTIVLSDDPSVAVAVRVADCAPILLGDRHLGTVGAAHAGWKGALAVFVSTSLVVYRFRKELAEMKWEGAGSAAKRVPAWIVGMHLIFLTLIVLGAHYMVVFIGLLLFFIGFTTVTREYQTPLNLRGGLLVAFFLGGLVIFGGPQSWCFTIAEARSSPAVNCMI